MSVGRVFAVYTLLRLLLFAACFGVLLVLGVPVLVALAGGLLLSSLLSLVALRRQRDVFVVALQEQRDRRAGEKARLRSLLDEDPTPADPEPR